MSARHLSDDDLALFAAGHLLKMIGKQPWPIAGCVDQWITCIMTINMHCETFTIARARYAHVFTACFPFLTSARTRSEVQLIANQMQCQCTESFNNVHGGRLHKRAPASSMPVDMKDLITCFVKFFVGQTKPNLFKVKRNARRNTRRLGYVPFPASPGDLYPQGDILGIHAILQCIDITDGWNPGIALVAALLRACRGYGVTTFVIAGAYVPIHGLFSTLIESLKEWQQLSEDDNLTANKTRDLAVFLGPLYVLLMELLEYATIPELQAFITSIGEERLMEACICACSAVPALKEHALSFFGESLRLGDNLDAWTQLGGLLYQLAAGVYDKKNPVELFHAYCRREARLEDPWLQAWRAWLWFRSSQRCAGPDCWQSHTSCERAFECCARCKVARYCSLECQRLAWKHPEVSHQAVCWRMRAVNLSLDALERLGCTIPTHPLDNAPISLQYKVPRDVVEPIMCHLHALHDLQFTAHCKSLSNEATMLS